MSRPDPQRFLGIYLDDHLAVLVGGIELVQRTLGETEDPAARAALEPILLELRDDRRAVEQVARSLGRRPSRAKQRFAWLAEKLGRLKLNGALTSRSPLSRVVELEGTSAVLVLARSLWRNLEHASPEHYREDAARRAARVEKRLTMLDVLRLAAASVAFDASGRAGDQC